MYEELSCLEQKYKMHDFPLNIAIEPTNYCNYNCIMCSHSLMTRTKGNMDIRTYKRIIDEVAEVNPDTRIYLDLYGEPFIVKYKLYYMIDYARKRGIKNINTNSNASLLDEEMSEMILDSSLSYISLDCDGYTKDTYENIRRGGKRESFYRNVEYLLRRKEELGISSPIVEVKIIEMPENEKEVAAVMSYWQEKGAWTARRRLHSWGGSNAKAKFSTTRRIACGKAVGVCGITWDGNILNCTADYDGSVIWGNVNKDSIQQIWRQRNEGMVKYHFNHEFDKLPLVCQRCNDWQIVGEERFDEKGNSINKNYNEKGKVFAR